tara:strand:- start:116 stop:244 length:129 start_codon:yes stop_codon:yes gene_type:complete
MIEDKIKKIDKGRYLAIKKKKAEEKHGHSHGDDGHGHGNSKE